MMVKKWEVWKVIAGAMLEGGPQVYKENTRPRNKKGPHQNILGHMAIKEGGVARDIILVNLRERDFLGVDVAASWDIVGAL